MHQPSSDTAAEPRKVTARFDRWAPVVLALLPFAAFYRVALQRAVFFAYDVHNYFYAYLPLGPEAVKRGELPLWNPYVFSGMPLLGDGQTALFYPPNWLFYVLPAVAALNYDVLVQFAIAGAGMYFFLRNRGLERAPVVLGSVTYMFCGYLSARVVHLSIMSGAALIPAVFLCVERALGAALDGGPPWARRRWIVAAATVAGLQLVAGHPQVPAYTAAALALYALVRAAEYRARTGSGTAFVRLPLTLAAIYAFGACLAAIQLVPWLELVGMSVRAAGAPFQYVFGAVLNRSDWLLQLFPYLYGAPQPLSAPVPMSVLLLYIRAWEHSMYVGMLPLALAAFGALGLRAGARHARRIDFAILYLVLLLLFSLLLAVGQATPFARLIYLVPVIGKLREPARALILASFALAALAAYGLQRVSLLDAETRRGQRGALTLIAGLLAAVPLTIVTLAPQPWFQRALRLPPLALEHLRPERWSAVAPVALAVASTAFLVWWSRRPATRATLAAATALVLLDVGGAAALFTPTTDAGFYDRRPAALSALEGSPGTFRKATYVPALDAVDETTRESLSMSWNVVYGVEDINGFNSLQTRRYLDYLVGRSEGDVSYGALGDERLFRAESPILSSLNVRYLFVPAEYPAKVGTGFRQVYANGRVTVYENERAYPRAFLVDAVRAEPDAARVFRTVTADGFDGRRLALLEVERVPPVEAPSSADTVRMTSWSPTRLSLATSTEGARVVVLSEMFFPGWRASVDGVETPVYRANYLFRAVAVPAGRHDVQFVYRPGSVLWGAAVTALAAAAALMLVTRSAARRGTGSSARN